MDHIDVDAYLGGRDGNGLRQLPGTVRTAAVSEMEYTHARSVVLGCFRAVRFSDAIRRKPRTVAVLCLLGLIIGVCFYFWLLSVTTQRFVVMLIKLARTLIHWCGHILNILIVMPAKGIYKLIRVLFGFVIAILLFLGRLVLQCLVPFGKLFRWMFRPLLKHWVTPRFMIRVGTRIAAMWKRWF